MGNTHSLLRPTPRAWQHSRFIGERITGAAFATARRPTSQRSSLTRRSTPHQTGPFVAPHSLRSRPAARRQQPAAAGRPRAARTRRPSPPSPPSRPGRPEGLSKWGKWQQRVAWVHGGNRRGDGAVATRAAARRLTAWVGPAETRAGADEDEDEDDGGRCKAPGHDRGDNAGRAERVNDVVVLRRHWRARDVVHHAREGHVGGGQVASDVAEPRLRGAGPWPTGSV